jgi:hypothetical protein
MKWSVLASPALAHPRKDESGKWRRGHDRGSVRVSLLTEPEFSHLLGHVPVISSVLDASHSMSGLHLIATE